MLAVGSNDKIVAIIDRETWSVLDEFERNGGVRALAWSSEDKYLAVGGHQSKTVGIIDVASGTVLREVREWCRVLFFFFLGAHKRMLARARTHVHARTTARAR